MDETDISNSGNFLAVPSGEALSRMRSASLQTLRGKACMRVVQLMQKTFVASALFTLVAASSASAQTPVSTGDYKPLHRIGTVTKFGPRALTNAAALKTFSMTRGMPDDI